MGKTIIKLVVSVAVSGILLTYVLKHFEIDKIVQEIKHADSQLLCLSIFLIIVAYLIRGYRWLIWERDLRYKDAMKIIFIGFMGNNLLPARFGELLRAVCTTQKTNEKYGATAALASIAIERVLDGFVL